MISAIGEILFDQYEEKKKLGGAPFNFIYHINKLTGNGNFISRIGNDENGKEILSFLNKNNISTSLIQVDEVHPTGIAKVQLNKNKIPSFNIVPDSAYDFITLTDSNEKIVKDSKILYAGTLAQRNHISKNTIQKLMNSSAKVFCDINLRQDYYDTELIKFCLNKTNILKLNFDELQIINKITGNESTDLIKSSEQLLKKYSFDLLCITVGDDGSYIFDENKFYHTKHRTENVVDTVGAGDAFSAILCIGYIKKMPVEKINELASIFAAKICTIEGALPNDDSIYEEFKNILLKDLNI